MTVHNTGIWWNILIKFRKQIEDSFAKIINIKVNSKPCQTLWWSFFWKSLLASMANSEPCHTSKMELFAKNSQKRKAVHYSAKTSILDVWQVSEYASKLASKVKDASFLNQFKHQTKNKTKQKAKKRKKKKAKLANRTSK